MYECHVIFDPKSCHVYRLLQSSSKVLGPKIHLNQVIRYDNMPDRNVIFDPKSCHVYRLLQSSSKVLGPKIHLNQVI